MPSGCCVPSLLQLLDTDGDGGGAAVGEAGHSPVTEVAGGEESPQQGLTTTSEDSPQPGTHHNLEQLLVRNHHKQRDSPHLVRNHHMCTTNKDIK